MNALIQPRRGPPPCPRPAERRREPRVARSVEVDVETGDEPAFVGTTLDLSLGGLSLEIGAPLVAGDRVRLQLRLSGAAGTIATDAVVRWVRELSGGLVIAGLSLPPLPTHDLHALRAFLEADA
jgi:hypothetical protein